MKQGIAAMKQKQYLVRKFNIFTKYHLEKKQHQQTYDIQMVTSLKAQSHNENIKINIKCLLFAYAQLNVCVFRSKLLL
jgi:hypothetical protein